jgi:molecular chaperone GrpE
MVRSPRELAAQKAKARKQQEHLFRELLTILDTLDHACEHWQQAEQRYLAQVAEARRRFWLLVDHPPQSRRQIWQWRFAWWRRLLNRLQRWGRPMLALPPAVEPDAMIEVLSSAREGAELTRQSMLAVLSEQHVVPYPVLGEPFDPTTMYALGQQASQTAAPNTVVQEVVRGYRCRDRILREAQVIVAVPAVHNGNRSGDSSA